MGLPWNYDGPADVFAEMAQVMPSMQNITWERLEREGAVTYPVDVRTSPATRSSSRPVSRPRAAAARSCRRSLSPPDELPDDEFPMVLSTGRMLEHWHTGSMTRRASVLDELEPESFALISPRDLRRVRSGRAT